MASTHSFVQVDGQIFVGTLGVAATTLVTTANELAKVEGDVNFNITYEQIESKWRRRVTQDRDTIAINGDCTINGVQFRASTLMKLHSNVSTGKTHLYGGATTATASFWEVRSSTAPKTVQLVFQFRHSYSNKKYQIYSRVQTANFPMPFVVDNYTKQDLSFNMLASSNGGAFFKILEAATSAY
jgi:hypothetical protein